MYELPTSLEAVSYTHLAPNKEREIIPAGGYVAKVKAAMVEDTKHGDRLIIYFEVADGDYRGFFQRDYDAQPQEDKKWRGVYRTYLPKEDRCV